MSKVKQGYYSVQNLEKYLGDKKPYWRSSWELAFMRMCDDNPHIIKWASEPLKIPYWNPIENKQTIYVPDFYIEYITNRKEHKREIIEIKPRKETFIEHARSDRDKYRLAVNAAKWQSVSEFCKNRGLSFKVITEDQIFNKPK